MSLQLVKLVGPLEIVETPRSPADRAAEGDRIWVSGYSVSGEPSAAVQAAIDALVTLGWPLESILWDDLGEQPASDTFTIQDSGSGSTAENVVLVLAGGTLTIADCVSASNAENITLTNPEDLNFVIQDSVSSSSTENVVLVLAGGTFAIADAVSASTTENVVLVEDVPSQIEFIAAGSAFNGETTGSDVIPLPGAAGDFLILCSNSSVNSIEATPAGWTAVAGSTPQMYYRISNGAPNVTLTTAFDGDFGNVTIIRAFAFRGVNSTTPFDVTPTSVVVSASGVSTVSLPITTTAAEAMVVAINGAATNVPIITGASGDAPNLVGNVRNTTFSSNLSLSYGLQSVSGSKTATFQHDGVIGNNVTAIIMALNPQ